MDRTDIEYADYRWNPVSGCRGPEGAGTCPYCYAQRIAKRFGGRGGPADGLFVAEPKTIFPHGFTPTFYPHRLAEPDTLRRRVIDGRPAIVFCSTAGDLFGPWVPDAWIKAVFATMRRNGDLLFLGLTKSPGSLLKRGMMYPDNLRLGTSVTGSIRWQQEEADRVNSMIGLRGSAASVALSIEPLLGPFAIELVEKFRPGWVMIGAQTGPGSKGRAPTPSLVKNLIAAAEESGCCVFVKDNLLRTLEPDDAAKMPREIPHQMWRR